MEKHISIGEKYDPAMDIRNEEEAQEYFEELVKHTMSFGKSREEAEAIERSNLGYFAGYYDHATRLRIERLFDCVHPVFGSAASKGVPTPEEAFVAGQEYAHERSER